MKKIAVRGGHNPGATGAIGLINELLENRLLLPLVIMLLKVAGYEVLDVTPPSNMSASDDLAYGVNKANAWGADLFISLHFNNAYRTYNGAIGSEVCVYSLNDLAQRVVNELGGLGFRNRGQKVRQELYELRKTKMPAIIIETCFVEATDDVALYKRLGVERIAQSIVKGITGQVITVTPESPKPIGDDWVRRLQAECNAQGYSNQKVDGLVGPVTLAACPLLKEGARGNITKLLQERLVSVGYNTNGIDGIFGNGTKNAAIQFQKSKGLGVDGIVGQGTWRKLLNM